MKTDIPVEPSQFLELAISRKNIQRADDESKGIRGLLDVETGVRYIISEQILLSNSSRPQTVTSHPKKPR